MHRFKDPKLLAAETSMFEQARRHRNVAGMLWESVAAHPAKVAVVEPGGSVTYGELCGRASAISMALRTAGVERGDRVVVLLERGANVVASYFAALATGALAVVLNPLLRPRQIEHALNQSAARVLLTSEAIAPAPGGRYDRGGLARGRHPSAR